MQKHFPLNQNNAAALQISMEELKDTVLRLTELLMHEAELLSQMRVPEVVPLQAEKQQLTRTLEMAQAQLKAGSPFMQSSAAEDREDLLLLTDDLAYAVEHNHRYASVARAINSRVMQAIMDVATENQRPASYNSYGVVNGRNHLTLSLNLNQQA